MRRLQYLFTCILISVSNVHAASFDCNMASNKVEESICSNKIISDLDDQISESFLNLKKTLSEEDFKILLRKQRKWLKERNNNCLKGNVIERCLVSSYENRLNVLNILSLNILPSLSEIESVCTGKGTRKLVNEALFDINNDGKNEIAEVCYSGTMNAPCINFKNAEGDEIFLRTVGFEWASYWTFHSSYFEQNGKVYNIQATDKGPSHIRYTTPENNSYVVCEFENIESEKFTPVNSFPDTYEICSLASKNELDYVIFQEKPVISREQVRAAGRYVTGVLSQALIDINNDGEKEYIAQLDYTSGAGRGCDFLYYDELSTNGKGFKITNGQTSLLKMQGVNLESRHPNCGGMNNRLFYFKGKLYYEINTSKERRISMLEGEKINNICDVKRSITTKVKHIGPYSMSLQ